MEKTRGFGLPRSNRLKCYEIADVWEVSFFLSQSAVEVVTANLLARSFAMDLVQMKDSDWTREIFRSTSMPSKPIKDEL